MEIIVGALMEAFPQIDDVYLFGSRRYRTGSARSDIDLLLVVSDHIKPSDLRGFTSTWCSALDMFVVRDGKAISSMNESYVYADSTDALIARLEALHLWSREFGKGEAIHELESKVAVGVPHPPTMLPNTYLTEQVIKDYFKIAERNELPSRPFIGADVFEVSETILGVIRRIIMNPADLGGNGQGRGGWTVNLQSEYDFQNLLWTVFKPWLPGISKESVTITYDDQDKRSDFDLFRSQVVVELKHIKDDGDKRAIVKTLDGLRGFYSQNGNVKVLIFAILVDQSVDIDETKWESDFSFLNTIPQVRTLIVRNAH